MKNGRNDPCPCGSGKKYKKCCLSKESQSCKGAKSGASKNISGLWKAEPSPKKEHYNSMDELYDEIRATGRIPHGHEYVYGDEESGQIRSIEVEELCKHGHPSSGSVTFDEVSENWWEFTESGMGVTGPCILCEMLKDGIEIGCPKCGKPVPDFSEEEILEIYEKRIEPLDITCPNCDSKFVTIDDEGFHVYPPSNTEE